MAIIENPEGSLARALRTSIPQLGATIAQQMQQGRQQQANSLALQSMFPNVYPAQLESMSYMSPDLLKHVIPQHGIANSGILNRMPQTHEQMQETAQPTQTTRPDKMTELMQSLSQTPASMLAGNKLVEPTPQPIEKTPRLNRIPSKITQPNKYMTFGEALMEANKPMTEYQKRQAELKERSLKQAEEQSKAVRSEHKEGLS